MLTTFRRWLRYRRALAGLLDAEIAAGGRYRPDRHAMMKEAARWEAGYDATVSSYPEHENSADLPPVPHTSQP